MVWKAFLVAKDFGASPAYNLSVLHPERIMGMTVLGMPFLTKPLGFDTLSEDIIYAGSW